MKPLLIFTLLMSLLFISSKEPKNKELPHLKSIFDKYDMEGAILIYNLNKKEYSGYNLPKSDSGFLPASTFKIVNTLIGLETGILKDSSSVFKWDGKKRFLPEWEKDLTLKEAFHLSCVPCYQELARKIGVKRMREYLQKFHYGNMDVDSSNIDLFWLEGRSRITPREQIEFLTKLYKEKLQVSKEAMNKLKKIMVAERTQEYTLRAKTGWAMRGQKDIGWYVGYIEKGNELYFFSTNIENKGQEQTNSHFAVARTAITVEVFKELGIIN